MSELLASSAATAAGFPTARPRRLRRTDALRSLVRETALAPSDFIMPYFVARGRDVRVPIGPMPGQAQLSVDRLVAEAREAEQLGVRAVLLFGLPAEKDALGSEAYAAYCVIQ